MKYDKEYIEKIIELFPNATIFNGEREIIYTPKKEKNNFIESIKASPEELAKTVQRNNIEEQLDDSKGPSLDD